MLRTTMFCLAIAFCCVSGGVALGVETLPQSQWPQFRGPNGNGVSAEAHPIQWSKTKNVAWSADVDGGGWSSPISANGRIFVTTAVSSEFVGPKGFGEGVSSMRSFFSSAPPSKPISFQVVCLRVSDGKQLWQKEVISRKPAHKIHPSNSYATESPSTDGKHVFAYFAAVGEVCCLDFEGNIKWSRNLGAYPTSSNFGTSSSLALHEGNLFIQCDNESKSFLCALNTETGADAWRIERPGRTSWSSPSIWKNRLRTELVVCGAGNVTAYAPQSGEVLWRLSGTGGAFSASPTFDEERIYFGNSGRNSRGPLIAVNAGAAGDLDLDEQGPKGVAWIEQTAAPGMCSPVVAGGKLYVLSRGILSCHEAETGRRLYRKRLPNASSVTASLWAAGANVYALNESGETSVIEVGDQFKLVGANRVPGLYWSTPSMVGQALLLRSAKQIHCIRN